MTYIVPQNNVVNGLNRIGKKIIKNEIYDRFNTSNYKATKECRAEVSTLINEDIIIEHFLSKDYINLLGTIKSIASDS